MRRSISIVVALFQLGMTLGLVADDMPLSHNLADYQFWGTPVDGLSAGVHIAPLIVAEPWPEGFRFQIAIKNDSTQLKYAFVTGMHHGIITLTAIDSSGHEYPLREKPGTPMENQPPIPIASGTQYFNVVFVHQDEFAATGGNKVVAVINLCDKPSRTDPQAHTVTIRTAPFQICTVPPMQATLPADPMMAQWKLQEADLLDKINKATTPNDRSAQAAQLAYFYLDTYSDFDKAAAMLPQLTSPGDEINTRIMLITRNPAFTAKEKYEKLGSLHIYASPEYQKDIDSDISHYKYMAEHPPDQK